jgi:hypothetical protein
LFILYRVQVELTTTKQNIKIEEEEGGKRRLYNLKCIQLIIKSMKYKYNKYSTEIDDEEMRRGTKGEGREREKKKREREREEGEGI